MDKATLSKKRSSASAEIDLKIPKIEEPSSLLVVDTSIVYEPSITVKEEVIIDVNEDDNETGMLDAPTDALDADPDSNELAGQNNTLVKLIRCPTCGHNRSCWEWLNRHISINHPYHVYKLRLEKLGERKIQKFIELGRRKCDQYYCSFCDESQSSIAQLSDHVQLHHMKADCVEMPCGDAGNYTEADNKLNDISGGLKGQNACPTCEKSCASSFDLKKHVKQSHEDIIYKDFLVVQGEGKILECMQIGDYDDDMYVCHWCQSEFSLLSTLENHVYLEHAKKLGLYLDEFSIEPPRTKKKVITPKEFSKCPTCSRNFSSWNNLHRHLKSLHRNNIYKHVSHVRGKSIITEAIELGRYKSYMYACMQCPVEFKVRLDLENHINSEHLKKSKQNLKQTNKKSTKNEKLSTVMTTSGTTAVTITEVTATSTTAVSSKKLQECLHHCPTCNKSFCHWRQFQVHIRRNHPNYIYKHSLGDCKNRVTAPPNSTELGIFENDKFICSICKREYELQAQLENHYNWEHMNLKPSTCQNNFDIRSLNIGQTSKEIQIMSNNPNEKGTEMNLCPTCGDNFLCWADLQTHIKRKHPQTMYKHVRSSENKTQFVELGIREDNMFVCTHCKLKYENRSLLTNHVIFKHVHLTKRGATKLNVCTVIEHADFKKEDVNDEIKVINIKEEKPDAEEQPQTSTSTCSYKDVVIKIENIKNEKDTFTIKEESL